MPDRIDRTSFGLDAAGRPAVILFTRPYCHASVQWTEALETRGVPFLRISVRDHRRLARRHGVRSAPAVLATAADGTVAVAHEGEVTHEVLDRVAAVAIAGA